ncbi:hypothetical protein L596_004311 [Steinernema carpocapsae]|uniref:Netrin receptor UNC5 n=1 Tax=Steinernema carpocapsae TaxID=34508 RepID=A0A4U8UYZ8_STECR|nr:hypothetical protein L596_004311 [Steinernema carpocapsae]
MLLPLLCLLALFHWHPTSAAVVPMDDEIIILESPVSGYITRGKPATLRCRALKATKIVFKCNSQWLDENSVTTSQTVDSSSSLSVLEATAEISRAILDNVGNTMGALQCQCYASDNSDVRVVRSETANLRLAYIRKHFYNFPTSQKVEEGLTVQLQCAPPDAEPKAEIFWLKDGQEIERSIDSNIILANDGSLIISAARLLDSGNYSCEARNVASRRATDPAEITVFVDGQWSAWSAWAGSCRMECDWLARALSIHAGDAEATYKILPRLRRNRVCNNPAPLHGGAPCKGEEEQFQECAHICKIDGYWSVWTPWSECSSQCRKLRTRSCIAPPPFNGGLNCLGNDLETVNCTSTAFTCTPSNSMFGLQSSNGLLSQDQAIVMVAAVSVVFLAGLICFLAAVIIFRRRICGGTQKDDDRYFSSHSGDVRSVLRSRTPKTLLSEVDPSESHLGLHSPNFMAAPNGLQTHYVPTSTLRSGKSYHSGYSARKFSGSRAALLGEYSSSNSSSGGKAVLLRSDSRMSDDNYATLYDIGGDEDRCYSTVCEQDQSATIVAAHGDCNGLVIEMRRSGAALTVGKGALSDERMIRLAVSDDVDERPRLSGKETYLSCVIVVELCETEPDTLLRRPYVVTFDHSASTFPKDNWQFLLYAKWSRGPYDLEGDWELVSIHGEENINTSVHVQVERERCHVMSERFGRFILTGRSKRANVNPTKRVRLAVYGPQNQHRIDLPIRVYCVPETRMAIETVRKQEEEHGVLLAEFSNFLLKEYGALCVCLEDISTGYALDVATKYLEISDTQHQWCVQNGLHCSLHVKVAEDMIDSLAGRIVIYQKGNGNDRQILEFHMDRTIMPPPPSRDDDKLVSSQFQLSAEIKKQLSCLLDPPLDEERDWRGLARKLNINNFIQYFATQSNASPTLLLLDLWEACIRGSPRAALDLLQTLRVMGRGDAVRILDQELSPMQYDFVHSP